MAAAGGVEHGLGGEEAADGFGDEALIPGTVGGLDAGFAGGSGRFVADALVGGGEDRVAEEGAGLGGVGREGGRWRRWWATRFRRGGAWSRWWRRCGGRGGRRWLA